MKKFTILLICSLFLLLFTGCGGIQVKKGAEDYIGSYYEEVEKELRKLGFYNIELKEIADLTSFSEMTDGSVSEISFDGDTGFAAKTKFPEDTNILLTYHTIKKLPSPVTYAQLSTMDYTEIAAAFTNAGFANVQTTEEYDLDPDETTDAYQDEVTLDYSPLPLESDPIPFDAAILVIRHYPYVKYDLVFEVDFHENFLFSRYDVDFFIDGALQETLEHGQDWNGTLRLKEGTHKITFSKNGDSAIAGSIDLELTEYTQAACKIACYNDKVTVELDSSQEEYADNDTEAVSETETKEKEETEPEKEPEYEKKEPENETEPNHELSKADMEEMVTNQACSAVRSLLEELEYTAEYEHEYTHMDFTGEIDYHPDQELDELGFIVTGVKQIDEREKTVTLYVNTTDNIERIKNQETLQTTLEKNFDPAVALSALEQYGKMLYPAGFRIDVITGRLAETPVDENTWFMKYTCKVTDAYGNKVSMTCEGKIEGPESDPTVYDFYVY